MAVFLTLRCQMVTVATLAAPNLFKVKKMTHNELMHLMTETLETGLFELHGRSVQVQEIEREFSPYSSSFSTERLQVRVDTNEWLYMFFKDLNPQHQLADARLLRGADLGRSQCELNMYRYILSRLSLGTPKLYGYRWEPQRALLWLFLEYVDAERLIRTGDFQLWVEAARWAARFHVAASDFSTTEIGFLPQHDQSRYAHCVRRLQNALGEFDAEERLIIQHALDHYETSIEHLHSLPYGLIHGEFFGENILVRRKKTVEPIVVIDWETAAIGPIYLDLISISTGRWTQQQRLTMWRAYFEQYQLETGRQLDWLDFCHDLKSVALYHALTWLGWWSNRNKKHMRDWLKELKKVHWD